MNTDKRLGVVITQFIVGFVSSFSVYVFLPLYLQMAKSLSVTSGDIEASLSLYYWGLTSTRLLYGSLAHYFSAKKMLVFGLSLFVLGGIICAVSESLSVLLIGRFIEGMGMSAPGVLGVPLIYHLYENETTKKIKYVSYLTALNILGPMLAPIAGEFFSLVMSWRVAFLFTAGAVLMCLFVYVRCVPKDCDKAILSFTDFSGLLAAFKKCLVRVDFIYYATPAGLLYGVSLSLLNKLPTLLSAGGYFDQSHFFYIASFLFFMAFLGGILTSKLLKNNSYKFYFYSCIGFAFLTILIAKYCCDFDGLLGIIFPLAVFSLIVGATASSNLLAIMSIFSEEKFLASGLYSFILNGIIALITLCFSFKILHINEFSEVILLLLLGILVFMVTLDTLPKFKFILKRS